MFVRHAASAMWTFGGLQWRSQPAGERNVEHAGGPRAVGEPGKLRSQDSVLIRCSLGCSCRGSPRRRWCRTGRRRIFAPTHALNADDSLWFSLTGLVGHRKPSTGHHGGAALPATRWLTGVAAAPDSPGRVPPRASKFPLSDCLLLPSHPHPRSQLVRSSPRPPEPALTELQTFSHVAPRNLRTQGDDAPLSDGLGRALTPPVQRSFPNGVYTPLVTPFTEDEELDIPNWQKAVLRLAKAGMGLVLLGTNGEGQSMRLLIGPYHLSTDKGIAPASHLSDDERSTLISSARTVLDQNGFPELPLLVGTGTGSAHQSIKLAIQAKEAGADYSIVIPPGYFAFAMGKNRQALMDFFTEVLDKSPIPVMIYNFP